MPYSRKHILLGALSGSLLTIGLGYLTAIALILLLYSRMGVGIIAEHTPKALLGLLFPLILIISGVITLRNALRGEKTDKTSS